DGIFSKCHLFRDLKNQYGQQKLTIRIVAVGENIPKLCFQRLLQSFPIIWMGSRNLWYLGKHRRKILISVEDDDSRISITPTRISKELINGIRQILGSAPEFTHGNEDVFAINANQDIGYTLKVVRFTCRLAFITPI